MLILGAGNLGKHIVDQLIQDDYSSEIIFFDEFLKENFVYNKYRVVNQWNTLIDLLKGNGFKFIIAIGNPRKRELLFRKITGGKYSSVISIHVGIISTYSCIGEGSLIQPGCCISHNVNIGKSNIIHANTLIGHDVTLSDFVTIGSNVNILKGVEIGKYSIIGPNCLIMDNIKIGKNVFIEPGVVVRKDIPDNKTIEFPF